MLINADGVGHTYAGREPLFRELSFEATSGEVVAVTGPSGSGKSTLLAVIGRLITPTEGRIVGRDVHKYVWVFQNPHGVARRRVADHVALARLADGATRKQAEAQSNEILSLFGLSQLANAQFRQLSGGEAQRLMLARAVATRPHVLLIDEPTAQLDPTNAGSVTASLHSLARIGAIVFVATHDGRVIDSCSREIRLGR